MRLTHLGHSCLLVEAADARVLVDPGGFSTGFEGLRDLDAIVVTHQHADHLDPARFADLARANPQARVLADPQSTALLTAQGVDADATRAGQEIRIAGLTLTGVGEWHAFNHDQMPTVNNVGIRFTADGEPTLYHPGDAYDGEAGEVDLLAVPVNAPWTAVRDSIGFVRRVAPTRIVPIHDGLLAPPGRALYLHHIGTFGGAEVLDLAGRGAVGVDA